MRNSAWAFRAGVIVGLLAVIAGAVGFEVVVGVAILCFAWAAIEGLFMLMPEREARS